MKVYIVKTWDMCECETACNCQGYCIEGVHLTEEGAKTHANRIFKGYYDEYDLED
jgi:hypothetical protein